MTTTNKILVSFLAVFGACTTTTYVEPMPADPANPADADGASSHVDPTADMAQLPGQPTVDMAQTQQQGSTDMAQAPQGDMTPPCGGANDACCANKMCDSNYECMHNNADPSAFSCRWAATPPPSVGPCGSEQGWCCDVTTNGAQFADGYCYSAGDHCVGISGPNGRCEAN